MKKVWLIMAVCAFTFACKGNQQETQIVETQVEEQQATNAVKATELEDIVTYYVASEKADCQTMIKTKCLQIKENEADDWEFFSSTIEGFNYEQGYEYKIEVRKEPIENPPADASSIRYILVKEISKEKVNK